MSQPKRLVLFGDQTEDIAPVIRDLYRRSRTSFLLKHFLQTSENALRRELAELPRSQLLAQLAVNSFLDLLDAPRWNVVAQTILFYVGHLGSFISHSENRSDAFSHDSSATVTILGFCTGLLPAAAVAVSGGVTELLELAPKLLRVTLRLALQVGERSDLIERSGKTWARAVTGTTATELGGALAEFHKAESVPPSKRAYVSCILPHATTISGPPSTLDRFFGSEYIRGITAASLPLSGAFHASHLTPLDWGTILGTTSDLDRYRLRENMDLISTLSGLPYESRTLSSLLPEIIADISQHALDVTSMVEGLKDDIEDRKIVLSDFVAGKMRRRVEMELGIEVEAPETADKECCETSSVPLGDVAIVGMAGRFPGGETLEDFWGVLEDGLDLHKPIPSARFDVDTHCDPTGKRPNTCVTPFGCFIDRPGAFDARLFNMSPREAAQTDPGQRLLLMSTYEALEMAGYSQTPEVEGRDARVGTFFGQTVDDYREYNAAENVDMYYVTGGIRAFSAGRVNYHFKWEGPAYSIDTACSSSLVAVQLACTSLLGGECNMAVAGGSNILTGSNMYAGLGRGGFLSTSGSCKTFDGGADGYCRGEGVGVVVLKRLEDALAGRDNVLGVVRAAATNHSARAVSITHPHVETQMALMRDVLRAASIAPAEVDYVEMHGTGTQAGDAAESSSVVRALAASPRSHPLVVGSVKPNVGHGEAAAGITSLAKALLMLRHDRILPHIGIKGGRNPTLPPLEEMNVHVAAAGPFKGQGERRRLLVNNFSAAGGNTSLLIEDGPRHGTPSGEDPRSTHVTAVSAKSAASLRENVRRLRGYLEAEPEAKLEDVAYTTTARRMHHSLRRAYVASSTDELKAKIDGDLAAWRDRTPPTGAARVALVFPGQGSDVSGVAAALFSTSTAFREKLRGYDALCTSQALPSFIGLVDGSETSPSPVQSQLCLVAIEVALADLWQSWGVRPSVVVGHSLGEYAALCVSGVLSVSDTLYLVGKRAALMQERCTKGTHQMLSARIAVESVRRELIACSASCPSVEVACINGPSATVVSGPAEEITSFHNHLRLQDVTSKVLEVPYSFHSQQMDPVLGAYGALAEGVSFNRPEVPVASTLLGELVEGDGVFSGEYLVRQTRGAVNVPGALESCAAGSVVDDGTLWLECGPGSVFSSFVRSTLGVPAASTLGSIEKSKENWSTVSSALAAAYARGIRIDWAEFHREQKGSLRLLDLPKYAFDLKNYWLDYTSRFDKSAAVANELEPTLPRLPSRCLQKILREAHDGTASTVEFVSDFGSPELSGMARGHLVCGLGLCPSSVYAEMAFAAATHLFRRGSAAGEEIPPMDLLDMEIFSPFLVGIDAREQLLKVEATQDSPGSSVRVAFSSRQSESRWKQHAQCRVSLFDAEAAAAEWRAVRHLVEGRSDQLAEQSRGGDAHRILKKMAYKLFQTVVTYSEHYHALDEVHMSASRPEAAAKLRFEPQPPGESFVHCPFWIDSLAQLGGFCLNVNPPVAEDVVYISHGWKSMRLLGALSSEAPYDGYVAMYHEGSGVYSGTVYVSRNGEIAATVSGLKFKQMKRAQLEMLLGAASASPLRSLPAPAESVKATEPPVRRPLPTSVTWQEPSPAGPSTFAGILAVIASEAGCDQSELTPGTRLEDMGVDSLLTISILQKIRELAALDVPSSLFTSHPTVADLERFFEAQGESREARGREAVGPAARRETTPVSRANSRASRALSRGTSRATSRAPSVFSTASSTHTDLTDFDDTPDGKDTYSAVKSTIAAEIGVTEEELHPSAPLADYGLDSLMTISVLGQIRALTGLDLPSSFFSENPTLADVRSHLVAPPHAHFGDLAHSLVAPSIEESPSDKAEWVSTSVLLQGRPSSGGQALFLLPDGSGSALSYIDLPKLSGDSALPVYALNSPFLGIEPDTFPCDFETAAGIFVDAVRSTQPRGPYLIAGWSMGGILAYEACRQLLRGGEAVELLALLDSPCPRTLPPLPAPTLGILEKAGLFSGAERAGAGVPLVTKRHFLGSVHMLEHFDPEPLDEAEVSRLGKVVVMWARDGVAESVEGEEGRRRLERALSDDEIAGAARDWLFGDRSDYGPAGWDRLIGKGVECRIVGGNHFSMIKAPHVRDVGRVLRDALAEVGK